MIHKTPVIIIALGFPVFENFPQLIWYSFFTIKFMTINFHWNNFHVLWDKKEKLRVKSLEKANKIKNRDAAARWSWKTETGGARKHTLKISLQQLTLSIRKLWFSPLQSTSASSIDFFEFKFKRLVTR